MVFSQRPARADVPHGRMQDVLRLAAEREPLQKERGRFIRELDDRYIFSWP